MADIYGPAHHNTIEPASVVFLVTILILSPVRLLSAPLQQVKPAQSEPSVSGLPLLQLLASKVWLS